VADIKFCGLTRVEDAHMAGALGAAYVGVIFAGGPRTQAPDAARRVLDGCQTSAKRVGVFAGAATEHIASVARAVRLDVVQLHDDRSADEIEKVRQATGAEVWAVVRVADALPAGTAALFDAADAVVLDARVDGMLGGTGVTLPWSRIARDVALARGKGRLVLAGGLKPENVALALTVLSPDVVDVSSGVESAPGIKDHARMRAFAANAAPKSPTQ
jgi:phosphoribosylanthranilate isomerase